MKPVFSALLVLCLSAFAQLPADVHIDSQYERGIKALNDGNAADAIVLCSLGDYKDSKARCAEARLGMRALVATHNARFTNGIAAMNQGRLVDAERLLASVKYGNYIIEAKQALQKVREMKQKKIAEGEEIGPPSDEIADISKRWRTAFLRGDAESLKKLESDDFTIIRTGDLLDRAQHLGEVSGRGEISRWYGEIDRQVQVINASLVIVTGRAFKKADVRGSQYPSGIQVTEVWQKKAGGWQVTHVHDSTFTTKIVAESGK